MGIRRDGDKMNYGLSDQRVQTDILQLIILKGQDVWSCKRRFL